MRRNRLEVAVRALLLAAAIIITIVIITLGISNLEQAVSLNNAFTENMNRVESELKDADIMQYDGKEMNGAQVYNFYKKYIGTEAADTGEFDIVITNANGTTTYSDGSGYDHIRTATDTRFVQPTSLYMCTIAQNDNGIITSAEFVIR